MPRPPRLPGDFPVSDGDRRVMSSAPLSASILGSVQLRLAVAAGVASMRPRDGGEPPAADERAVDTAELARTFKALRHALRVVAVAECDAVELPLAPVPLEVPVFADAEEEHRSIEPEPELAQEFAPGVEPFRRVEPKTAIRLLIRGGRGRFRGLCV